MESVAAVKERRFIAPKILFLENNQRYSARKKKILEACELFKTAAISWYIYARVGHESFPRTLFALFADHRESLSILRAS